MLGNQSKKQLYYNIFIYHTPNHERVCYKACGRGPGASVPPLCVSLPQPVSPQPPVLLSLSAGMSWPVKQRAGCSDMWWVTETRRYQLGQSCSSQTPPGSTRELLLHFPSVAAYIRGALCCASLCPVPGFKNR